MAYNTSFPTIPQNGVPFDLAEMNLLGESGMRREAVVSRACPAVWGTCEKGCFPAPGGRKQAPSRGELESSQRQGKLWSLSPSVQEVEGGK